MKVKFKSIFIKYPTIWKMDGKQDDSFFIAFSLLFTSVQPNAGYEYTNCLSLLVLTLPPFCVHPANRGSFSVDLPQRRSAAIQAVFHNYPPITHLSSRMAWISAGFLSPSLRSPVSNSGDRFPYICCRVSLFASLYGSTLFR